MFSSSEVIFGAELHASQHWHKGKCLQSFCYAASVQVRTSATPALAVTEGRVTTMETLSFAAAPRGGVGALATQVRLRPYSA